MVLTQEDTMMATHPKSCALVLVCATLLPWTNQTAATVLESPLDLPALIEEALAQNPSLQAARKQWEATREQIEQATVLPDPTFGVQLWNFPQNGNLATSPGRTQNTIYTLAQKFPFPGKLPLKGEVAGRAAGISEQMLRLHERDLISRVKQTYMELFFAHKDLEIHHEHVDVLKQLFDTATSRFRAGKGNQVDVLKAQVELSTLYQRVPVLEQQQRVMIAKLNTFLNREPRGSLGIPREPPATIPSQSLEDLERLALSTRPELKAAELAIEKSQHAQAYAERQYYPDFEVGVQRFQNFQAVDGFGAIATVNIPFSFWTKHKYDAGVREAKAAAAAARAEHHSWLNLTRFQITEVAAKVHAQQQVADLYRTTILPQAEQHFEAARAAYRTGRTGFLDVLEAERAVLEFRLAYYRALAEREVQMAVLEQVIGSTL
jgi:cobalt-zinc-cadmium efflux system outer membrane protein